MVRWVIFIAIYLVIDWYSVQAVKTVARSKWVPIIFVVISLLVLGNFIYQMAVKDSHLQGLTPQRSFALGLLITFFIPKLIIVLCLFFEDIFRIPQAVYSYFNEGAQNTGYFPNRRKFISTIGLGLAAIPFGGMLYGMYKGKYNYKVIKHQLVFNDLPEAFNGYTITQISDIHCGSFDNYDKVAYGIDLINQQQSDVILFTGDMVNNQAAELKGWEALFSKLKAKDGKFSVLGNHDYGDYVRWESPEAKHENLETLKATQKQMGFDLLLNESRYLERDGQRIALVGVENWGRGGFKKAGNLHQAATQISAADFKILMSHDPSHWEDKVIDDAYKYHLTLSGHTHGMQFGIEIPGWIKWSPVKWRYKYWAGIYKQKEQYINVNRGFGYLAYPGRVGIWPEITVIELKRAASA